MRAPTRDEMIVQFVAAMLPSEVTVVREPYVAPEVAEERAQAAWSRRVRDRVWIAALAADAVIARRTEQVETLRASMPAPALPPCWVDKGRNAYGHRVAVYPSGGCGEPEGWLARVVIDADGESRIDCGLPQSLETLAAVVAFLKVPS